MSISLSRRAFTRGLVATTALVGVPAIARPTPSTRPNIITILLDDVGYSDIGCFGSEIRTPAIDALAQRGLRYVRFDTKAVCSATRAALMTGRNSHTVNMPDVPDLSGVLPAERTAGRFYIPDNAQNIAQVLHREGYATWAVGKWHLIPSEELPEDVPHKSWPLQRGFDYFYGFARGWTDQYRPTLVEGDRYIKRDFDENYHLSADLADKAISLITGHRKSGSSKPFYLNLAFGAAHAPIQVPREYSQKYDAIYAKGWDAIREERFERMKAMGIIPQNTLLPPRTADDRAWDSLSDGERTLFARFMAVYAGFLEHCDEQIGRVLEALKANGIDQDTLIIFFSDNGAASEAGQKGEFDGLYRPNTLSLEEQLARIDELGTGKTQAEYPRPWALAGDTPLRRYKLWPYSGGTRTSMVVSWPRRIKDHGAIRRQLVDVVDLGPTVLAAAGTQFPAEVDGVAQLPVAGQSIVPTFLSAKAKGRQVQYFELRGNRAITDGRWRAVAMHQCGKPFDRDIWELFDIEQDFSESTDLSARHPEVIEHMKALWEDQWKRYGIEPLRDPTGFMCGGGLSRDIEGH